jgi:hypothetical protein
MAVVVVLFIWLLSATLCGWLVPYSVNSWLAVAGKDPAVGYWAGFGVGLIPAVGQIAVPVAIVTWIAMMFLA